MNAYHKLAMVGLAAALGALLTPSAQAQVTGQRMQVTFSAPVEVPGEVLPAGSYVFESMDSGHLTRILSADKNHVFATMFTIPEQRLDAVDKPTVELGESPNGSPKKVEAWFVPGSSTGSEFIYNQGDSK